MNIKRGNMVLIATATEGKEAALHLIVMGEDFPIENPFVHKLVKLLRFSIQGRGYRERKESLREIAINYAHMESDFCGLSYGELHKIQSWFRRNGKRYGLLRELEENAIC